MKIIFVHTYVKAANNQKTYTEYVGNYQTETETASIRIRRLGIDFVAGSAVTTIYMAGTAGTTLAQFDNEFNKEDQE